MLVHTATVVPIHAASLRVRGRRRDQNLEQVIARPGGGRARGGHVGREPEAELERARGEHDARRDNRGDDQAQGRQGADGVEVQRALEGNHHGGNGHGGQAEPGGDERIE